MFFPRSRKAVLLAHVSTDVRVAAGGLPAPVPSLADASLPPVTCLKSVLSWI